MARRARPFWTFEIEWQQEDQRVYTTDFGLGSSPSRSDVFDGQKNISLQLDYGTTITIFGVTLIPASTMTLTPPATLALGHLDRSHRNAPAGTLELVPSRGRRFEYRPRAAHSISLTPLELTSYVYLNLHSLPDVRARMAGFDVWVRYEFRSSPPPGRAKALRTGPGPVGGTKDDKKLFKWTADVTRAVGN